MVNDFVVLSWSLWWIRLWWKTAQSCVQVNPSLRWTENFQDRHFTRGKVTMCSLGLQIMLSTMSLSTGTSKTEHQSFIGFKVCHGLGLSVFFLKAWNKADSNGLVWRSGVYNAMSDPARAKLCLQFYSKWTKRNTSLACTYFMAKSNSSWRHCHFAKAWCSLSLP